MKITKNALSEIKEHNAFLEISLDIGGCRGFKFIFEYIFDISILDFEYIVLFNCIILDKNISSKVEDFELDYIKEFGYEDFLMVPLKNYKTCGCGISFNK